MPDDAWRFEKSQQVIQDVCYMLEHTSSVNHDLGPGVDLREHFSGILWNATKLYCDAAQAAGGKGVGQTWSPDLPKFLFDHPERCQETLKLIADGDYRDNYYDGKDSF